jgi:NADH-quinone oxidoreductase subunit F
MVMDDTVCMVWATLNLAHFFHHESCGQCTPCREGTGWLEKLLIRFDEGKATEADIKTLDTVAKGMLGTTICVLSDAAAMPVRSFLQKFPEEFEAATRQGSAAA